MSDCLNIFHQLGVASLPAPKLKKKMKMAKGRYVKSISQAFDNNHTPGASLVPFAREELFLSKDLESKWHIRNIGDVPHSFKVGRYTLPDPIRHLAPDGHEWTIIGTGRATGMFMAVTQAFFHPNLSLPIISMPNMHLPYPAVGDPKQDEQEYLTTLDKNNMFLHFTGIRLTQVQPHKRMFVKGMGQVEIDAIDRGTDSDGVEVIVPKSAKIERHRSKRGILNCGQIMQDLAGCYQQFPGLSVRPVGALALDDRFVLMEFALRDGAIVVVNEKHYAWTK